MQYRIWYADQIGLQLKHNKIPNTLSGLCNTDAIQNLISRPKLLAIEIQQNFKVIFNTSQLLQTNKQTPFTTQLFKSNKFNSTNKWTNCHTLHTMTINQFTTIQTINQHTTKACIDNHQISTKHTDEQTNVQTQLSFTIEKVNHTIRIFLKIDHHHSFNFNHSKKESHIPLRLNQFHWDFYKIISNSKLFNLIITQLDKNYIHHPQY